MQKIEHLTLDAERALYGLCGAAVSACTFDGPADGESALKECRELTVTDCTFRLRYPLWHLTDALIRDCILSDTCRAPLWYGHGLTVQACRIEGVKAIRECEKISIEGCTVSSDEFGWRCRHLRLSDSSLESGYAFFGASDIAVSNLDFRGKYAFQYVEGGTVDFSTLSTKDAFWHSKDITVTDSILEGEYLGWYSENLTLKNCVISGTQPFVCCKNLTLIDCVMEPSCDLAFERSEVHATLRGRVTSVKNPLHGEITAESFGTIIFDEQAAPGTDCAVRPTGQQA